MHRINPHLTPRQHQVILGTILGGSSIIMPNRGKNCYLSMRSKDAYWLSFKASELENLASTEPITVERTNRWHSICYPLFNNYHRMFYDGKNRKIDEASVDLLQDIGIAVWYGDCGELRKGRVWLNTHVWKEAGTEALAAYLRFIDMNISVVKERGNFRIVLDQDSSNEFLRLVMPALPPKFTIPTNLVHN